MTRVVLLMMSLLMIVSCSKKEERVLIFSKTEGYRHGSIEAGTASLQKLLSTKNIAVDTTENAATFNEDELKKYSAVIFLSTTGDVLNNTQQADFERYIQAGGGFVGIHSATDTEYKWPWYNRLVGAYFNGHPKIQEAVLKCANPAHGSCEGQPEEWKISDEWYNFKSINPDIQVIMEIDESSYKGGTNGDSHPMVWQHSFDGGRAFYTGLGHKVETFEDPVFQKQMLDGIEFVIGDNSLNYAKAKTMRVPNENRFSKNVLDFNLNEPMEIEELGDRGILFVERRGAIKLYEHETAQTLILDSIDVHYDDEDGLLGVAVDPNFDTNNWLYFFYSPNVAEPHQHVSRFTLVDDKLQDEKILFEVPMIRECCHSGGSLEFGPEGLLYVGIGDNTNPFRSSGYAPIDERPERQLWDAQRSASNTNDLRGAILRIKPEDDGTYTIPEGNLFAEGTAKTRSEIYVMGCRNPFRFSIDSKNSNVYWGDVGPDAGAEDSLRGPAGMGEFNQAKKAGYYGWPYSRGNNQMYVDYDFSKEVSLERFDPNNIINNSPNNTGLQKLPPIQESLIWYTYRGSKEFPWLGDGGINPMSGPIYHSEDYDKSESALPAYFDNKWFIYEWMRDWVYVVHLDDNGDFVQADPFMPGTEFSHPMDMLVDRNGELYVLEYGQKWNSRNLDARLSVIKYNSGNRAPIAHLTGDKEVGAAPLTVNFSANESFDHDKDDLRYVWTFEEEEIKTDSPEQAYTFNTPGVYDVLLEVIDGKGESSTTNTKILVGNEPPKIQIDLGDSNTAYWDNRKLNYSINVADAEDGNISSTSPDASKVKVTFDYIPEGEDQIISSIGHQENTDPLGLQLINKSDCKSCHAIDAEVAGPSYMDVAKKYDLKDKQTIMHRVIKGSQGVWGERMMSAHPQLSIEDVGTIVDYILSLDAEQKEDVQIAMTGSLKFDQHEKGYKDGTYVLMASYLDQGNPEVEGSALSVVEKIVFKTPRLEMENAVNLDRSLKIIEKRRKSLVGPIKHGKHIQLGPIAYDNLKAITIGASFEIDTKYYGKVEVRKGAVDGELLGESIIEHYHAKRERSRTFDIKLKGASGTDALFLVFVNEEKKRQTIMNGDYVQLYYAE